ncbi:hypothetical protein F5Y05DRAFT_414236 [Hypoxylon sp. FL0543]|nr:hypothetical protein F5Y05DRAFT_414236 [Hypoxylon sp. FL0543]
MPPKLPRKEEWEYSKNKNTIRARQRKERLSPYQREVEQAKAADQKSITRSWKRSANTNTYKMATDEGRKMILENVKREVMDQRRKKGIDALSKEEMFMARQSAAANTPDPLLTYDNLSLNPATAHTSTGIGPSRSAAPSSLSWGVDSPSEYQHTSPYISQSVYTGQTAAASSYGDYDATVDTTAPTMHLAGMNEAPNQLTYENDPLVSPNFGDKARIQALEGEVVQLRLQLAASEQKVGTLETRVDTMARMMGLGPGVVTDIQALADASAKVANFFGKVAHQANGGSGDLTGGDIAGAEDAADREFEADNEYGANPGSEGFGLYAPFTG